MPMVRSTVTIRLSVPRMDSIQKQEDDLKRKLDDCDTLDERREIRRQLRELRKKAESLDAKKDINANIIDKDTVVAEQVRVDSKKDEKKTTEEIEVRITTAEERRHRREQRLNEKNKEPEDTSNNKEEQTIETHTKFDKQEEQKDKQEESKKENEKSVKLEIGQPQVTIESDNKVRATDKTQDIVSVTLNSTQETTIKTSLGDSKDSSIDTATPKADNKNILINLSRPSPERKFEPRMNGPMRSYSLRNKDTGDSMDGNKFDRGTRSSLYGDKSKARGTIGKALSVSQMKEKFGQGGTAKPVEFGSSFAKKTPEITREPPKAMAKPSPVTSNLRETNPSESYRREVPRPKQHHKTAPAGIVPPKQDEGIPGFGIPGLGGNAEDRMAYFRQAAEKEKAKKEKEAERQRLQSAPAQIEVKENTRTAPCKKKLDGKRPLKRTKSISSIVLDWCKEMVRGYGVEIKNFSSSWNDGMAFCALIHRFEQDAFDFNELKPENREHNFRLAFETANKRKNIPMLLDVVDMVHMKNPEPRSVQCYIQWIWRIYGPTSGSYNEEEIKAAQIA